MDRSTVALAYGTGRIALSVVLAVFPGSAKPWIGAAASDRDVRSVLRLLAVRDALLGVALLSTSTCDGFHRRMLRLCALADLSDAVVSVGDWRRSGRRGAALAALTAAIGAATGLSLAERAGSSRSSHG